MYLFYGWAYFAVVTMLLGIYSAHGKIKVIEGGLFGILLFFGCLNELFIGSLTLKNQGYILASVFIPSLLMSSYVKENYIKNVIYINAFIIIYRLYTEGINARLYVGSSENYISVFSLYPVLVYYTLCENNYKKITILPALITFFVCILGKGRSGILVGIILFFGIFSVYLSKTILMKKTRLIIIFTLFCVISGIAMFIGFTNYANSPVFHHFARSGFSSPERIIMWSDYINYASTDWKNFWFGVDVNDVLTMKKFHNPHSSFIAIHATHGIVVFFVIMIMIGQSLIYGFKNKRWIYLICFFSLLLRGATDVVFWKDSGVPIFFFFLFIPHWWNGNNKLSKPDTVLSR